MRNLFDNDIQPGDRVTCRPDGRLRGATVVEVNDDGSIDLDCPCPRTQRYTIPKGAYQLSRDWNNEITRKKL
jgi:hypothetical protein